MYLDCITKIQIKKISTKETPKSWSLDELNKIFYFKITTFENIEYYYTSHHSRIIHKALYILYPDLFINRGILKLR